MFTKLRTLDWIPLYGSNGLRILRKVLKSALRVLKERYTLVKKEAAHLNACSEFLASHSLPVSEASLSDLDCGSLPLGGLPTEARMGRVLFFA